MILVTGANGFIGGSIIDSLLRAGLSVRACSRRKIDRFLGDVELISIEELSEGTNWSQALQDVDVVIHTAARVHIMKDEVRDPLSEFRKVNAAGALNLATQAAEAGARRFIFISSIKVNGDKTTQGQPFKVDDASVSGDPYGASKYEAERGLLTLAKRTEMEVVIIRPPLVYGPGVKANFASMMGWVSKGIPLPLGAVHNQRSLVALDNLVDFIGRCIDHPKAGNEIFLISDGGDVSTTELLKKTAKAFGKKACLLPVPVSWMILIAKLFGKSDMANRLFASLQVDSSKARDLLGWEPVISMEEQLKKTAQAYLNEKNI